jgi:hypothetical protein
LIPSEAAILVARFTAVLHFNAAVSIIVGAGIEGPSWSIMFTGRCGGTGFVGGAFDVVAFGAFVKVEKVRRL